MKAKGKIAPKARNDSQGQDSAEGAEYDSQGQDSAEGAEYDSQGQVRSEAEHVAPGCYIKVKPRPERPK